MAWVRNSKTSVILLAGLAATATITVGGLALWYLFYKIDERDYAESTQTSRHYVLECQIPSNVVGAIIGRKGDNIHMIQDQSETRITFNDSKEGSETRCCVIRGSYEGAHLAQSLILKCISEQPILETETIYIPMSCCGMIIGKHGDNVRSLSRSTNTKITILTKDKSQDSLRAVTIRGTRTDINVAKNMIQKMIRIDAPKNEQILVSSTSFSPKEICLSSEDSPLSTLQRSMQAQLAPTGGDGYLEIYVSAVKSPFKFWVQALGPKATELDKLIESMTSFYSSSNYSGEKIAVGDIVAAIFDKDNCWYRARVDCIVEDDYSHGDSEVTVLYVDFGDTMVLAMNQVRSLDTQFLRLQFQAIECKLSGVLPKGGVWSQESISFFNESTYAAQWKFMMARVDKYEDVDGNVVPHVYLVDTNSDEDLEISKLMVDQGYANWIETDTITEDLKPS